MAYLREVPTQPLSINRQIPTIAPESQHKSWLKLAS